MKLLLTLSLCRLPLLGRVGDLVEAARKFFLLLRQLLGPLGKLRSTFLQRLRGLLRISRRLGSFLSRLVKLPGLSLLARPAGIRSRLRRRLGGWRIRPRLLSRFDRQLSRFCREAFLLLKKFLRRRLPGLRLSTLRLTWLSSGGLRLRTRLTPLWLRSYLGTLRRRALGRS